MISDWNMPQVTGIELLRHVRAKEGAASVPFIIVSGESLQENILEAAKNKVTDYIIKPFSPDTLKNKVEKIPGRAMISAFPRLPALPGNR